MKNKNRDITPLLCIRVTGKNSLKTNSQFPLFHHSYLGYDTSHQAHLINPLNGNEKIGCLLILFFVIFKCRSFYQTTLLSYTSLSFYYFLTHSPPAVLCSCLENYDRCTFGSFKLGPSLNGAAISQFLTKLFFFAFISFLHSGK